MERAGPGALAGPSCRKGGLGHGAATGTLHPPAMPPWPWDRGAEMGEAPGSQEPLTPVPCAGGDGLGEADPQPDGGERGAEAESWRHPGAPAAAGGRVCPALCPAGQGEPGPCPRAGPDPTLGSPAGLAGAGPQTPGPNLGPWAHPAVLSPGPSQTPGPWFPLDTCTLTPLSHPAPPDPAFLGLGSGSWHCWRLQETWP